MPEADKESRQTDILNSKMADTNNILAKITKGSHKKNDALMMMSPECNWGQFLTPAPYAIALLGDLLLISTDTDFSLEEKAPSGGYKLLRHPSSFRACLVQVTNEGWTAFNAAHTNMNGIRLYCSSVDVHVRNAVRFLLQGSQREVEKMIPMSLAEIRDVADECLILVKDVKEKFVGLMNLIAELLEASTATRGAYDEKLKETKTAIKVAKFYEEKLKQDVGESQQRLANLNSEVEAEQEKFEKAIDDIPSGGEILGLMAGEALVEGMRTILNVGLGHLSQRSNTATGQPASTTTANPSAETIDIDVELSKQKVYKEVDTIYKFIVMLYDISTSKDGQQKNCSPDLRRVSTEGSFILQSLESAQKYVDSESKSGDVSDRVSSVCKDAISVCNELQTMSKNFPTDNKESKIEDLVQRVHSLKAKGQELEAEASSGLGKNPLDTKSPYLSQVPPQKGNSSVAQTEIENTRFKTQIAKEKLKDAKQRQDKAYDELRSTNEKLTKILADLAKLNIETVDFDTIRELLVKGIKALAYLSEQWAKLVSFFQMLSNIITISLNRTLDIFIKYVKAGRDLKMDDYSLQLSDVFRDVFFVEASTSSQIAYVVQTVAEAYVKISEDHLMDQITGLSQLIALDPKKDKDKITMEKNKLFDGCTKAQNAIQKIIIDEKTKFQDNIDSRIAKITAIEAELPPIFQEKEKKIKTSVAKGFARDKAQRPKLKNVDDWV